MRVCGSRASSSMHKSRFGVSGGGRGRNDVENTGINHSVDGKVKTDRSFTFPRFMLRERIQYPKLRVLIRNR